MAAPPTTPIGYAGGQVDSWWTGAARETTPELMWPLSTLVYDRMRRQDSQVKSVLRAVTLPVRRTQWRLNPNGARDEVVQLVADDLGLPISGTDGPAPRRNRDRFSWKQHLQEALLSLVFGHMPFEQQYRIVNGQARLRKLGPRMPQTLSAINVADDGGLVSIEQWAAKRPIPVSQLVMYCHEREGGDWWGTSLLRSAYKHWLIKDRLLRVDAQVVERNGMGIPLYEGAERETDLSAGRQMAEDWRAGDASGAAIPNGAKLTLQGVSGSLPPALPSIRYHDEQIGRGVLAHVLNLGQQTGSWALGTTFMDFFTLSLQTVAEDIADTANQHVVEDLVDVNFGEDEAVPLIEFDEIGSRAAATAQAIKLLVDAGALSSDPALERHLRQQYGLPAPDPNAPPPAPDPEDLDQ